MRILRSECELSHISDCDWSSAENEGTSDAARLPRAHGFGGSPVINVEVVGRLVKGPSCEHVSTHVDKPEDNPWESPSGRWITVWMSWVKAEGSHVTHVVNRSVNEVTLCE